MALAKAFSAAVHGIDAYLVEVEVDVGRGLAGQFPIVGLPDAGVQEARERVRSAIRNSAGSNFRVASERRLWYPEHRRKTPWLML